MISSIGSYQKHPISPKNNKGSGLINEKQKLTLLCPQSICSQYKMEEKTRIELVEKLRKFQELLHGELLSKDYANLKAIVEGLEKASAMKILPSEVEIQNIKREELEEYNKYFMIEHVVTEIPAAVLLYSAIAGYINFMELTEKSARESDGGVIVKPGLKPLLIWKRCHWIFFIFIQGLIIFLLRFEKEFKMENFDRVAIELETGSELMFGAGAAMIMAGSYSRKEYEEQIFPTMEPPNVKAEGFSGLMYWDHAYLVTLWKQNKKTIENLPACLQNQYDKYLRAYKFMASAHTSVCSKFGGGEVGGSVKHPTGGALLALEKIVQARWRMVNPSSKSVDWGMEMMDDIKGLVETGFKSHIQLLERAFNLDKHSSGLLKKEEKGE